MPNEPIVPYVRSPVYRRTFLRKHVAAELARADEVLAVQRTIDQLEGPGRKVSERQRLGLLDRFFFCEESGARMYLPLALRPVEPKAGARGWASLTEALAAPGETGGILLSARTGAGKTLATLRAFRDCVVHVADRERNEYRSLALEGQLPVRLRVESPWVESLHDLAALEERDEAKARRKASAIKTEGVVLELIAGAVCLGRKPPPSLTTWIEHSPPLLLFVDLNAVGSDVLRIAVARSLAAFQRRYAGQHRCVVTYRSTQLDDGTHDALPQRDFFRYDLAPIHPDQAKRYLLAYWEFEATAHVDAGLKPPTRDPAAEAAKLAQFIDKLARGGESLISMPLLMHLVSVLGPGEIDQLQTLTDLYRQVSERLLREQKKRHGLDGTVVRDARVAMVRVALAIQSQGPHATHLPGVRDFERFLAEPEAADNETRMRWRVPKDSLWRRPVRGRPHPYYDESIATPESTLREYALFRGEKGGVAYLHDSFLYYYEALALREHRGPGEPPESEELRCTTWCRAVVDRVHARPALWANAFEFLGGTIEHEADIEALLEEFLLVDPVPPEWPDLLRRLTGGASGRSAVAASLHRLAALHGSTLRRFPEQLAAQVYGFMYSGREEAVSAFAKRLWPRLQKLDRAWLRLVDGEVELDQIVLTGHLGQVNAVVELADGRLVSGGDDGTVRVWDLATSESVVVARHKGGVTALAALVDGRIASGSWDNTVRVSDTCTHKSVVVARHKGGVTALVALVDGRIASGSRDHTVRVSDPRTRESVEVARRGGEVTALAALVDGRIAIGGHQNSVVLIDSSTGKSVVVARHGDRVTALAALVDGRIVSGSDDNTARVSDPRTGQSVVVARHYGCVTALAALGDGRIVSGSDDGTVRIIAPRTGEPVVVARLGGRVTALAALGDGRIASGSDDNTVRVSDPRTGVSVVVARHDGQVAALAALADGRIASGSHDSFLKISNSDTLESLIHRRHEGRVRVLTALGDGRIASGSDDNTVRVSDPRTGQSVVVARHDGQVTALAALIDGRIVSGSDDGTVQVSDPRTGVSVVVARRGGDVTALAALVDGRIAIASHRDTVILIEPSTGKSVVVAWHDDRVTALAALVDGRIASGSCDDTVRVIDTCTHKSVVVGRHKGGVTALVALVDGRIASGSRDHTVRVSDPRTRESVEVARHDGAVTALAALADGRIASGSVDKTVRVSVSTMMSTPSYLRSLSFATTSDVLALAFDAPRWRLVAGLRDGRVLSFAIEPEASQSDHVP